MIGGKFTADKFLKKTLDTCKRCIQSLKNIFSGKTFVQKIFILLLMYVSLIAGICIIVVTATLLRSFLEYLWNMVSILLLLAFVLCLIFYAPISEYLTSQKQIRNNADITFLYALHTVVTKVLQSSNIRSFLHFQYFPVAGDIEIIPIANNQYDITFSAPQADPDDKRIKQLFEGALQKKWQQTYPDNPIFFRVLAVEPSLTEYGFITITIEVSLNPYQPQYQTSTTGVYLGHDEMLMRYDTEDSLYWNYQKYAHALIVGKTGSGKTYFLKKMLSDLAQDEHIKFVLCDYKGSDDFSFLENCADYYPYRKTADGISKFYTELERRQQQGVPDQHIFCVIDEYAAFLTSLEKKQAEAYKAKTETALMLGRSLKMHLIICQQRADAIFFGSSRDNFSFVAAFGVLSKESVNMLFSEYKEQIDPIRKIGTANCIIGNHLYVLHVPAYTDTQNVYTSILNAVTRSFLQESCV